MSARLFRKSWWVDFRHDGERYRLRSPDNSYEGALEYEAGLRRKAARGGTIDRPRRREARPTTEAGADPSQSTALPHLPAIFGAFAEAWFRMYVLANNKPSEQRTKRIVLDRHILPAFATWKLADIGSMQIESYKARKLAERLTPKTINNHLGIISKCLRTAVEWDVLSTCPRVRLLKTALPRTDFLTVEEAAALVSSCREPMWRIMLVVALHTGLRMGKLFGLEWQDVDLDRRVLTVRQSIVNGIAGTPKNGRVRHIPMTEHVHDALANAVGDRVGYVFHRGDGRPLAHRIASNAIRRACKAASIRPIGWHTLRHTFASRLAALGVPMPAVQALLGHSTLAMTMRYTHMAPSALANAVGVLEPLDALGRGQQVGNRPRKQRSDAISPAFIHTSCA